MTRLDAEYDPAEHHDLDRIEPYPNEHKPEAYCYVCCCGSSEWGAGSATEAAARRAHRAHHEHELGW